MTKKSRSEDIDYRPIVINKSTLDIIFKEDEPAGLIALYNFYYYTAIWQKTNQPKATIKYAAEGLKLSLAKVRRYKAGLIKIGLIEEVQIRSKDNSRIAEHYIKVNYYSSYPNGFLHSSKDKRVVNRDANTYRANNTNTYRANSRAGKATLGLRKDGLLKKDKTSDRDAFDVFTDELIKLLRSKRKVMRIPDKDAWKKRLVLLHRKDGVDKKTIRTMIKWYAEHIGEAYVPDIRTAGGFRDKFDKLVAAKERYSTAQDAGEVSTKYRKVKNHKRKMK